MFVVAVVVVVVSSRGLTDAMQFADVLSCGCLVTSLEVAHWFQTTLSLYTDQSALRRKFVVSRASVSNKRYLVLSLV